MKNTLFILLIIVSIGFSQSQFVGNPTPMAFDSLGVGDVWNYHDIYFTSTGTAGGRVQNSGSVDFLFYGDMINSTTDSAVINVYGINVINRADTSTIAATADPNGLFLDYCYIDSTYVGVVPLTTTEGLTVFPIENLFVDYPLYDGLRFTVKKNGSDTTDRFRYWYGIKFIR